MRDLSFLAADLLMIVGGYWAGLKFLQRHRNYLLGLEWMIVATSGVNFLVWALLGSNESSPQFAAAFFLDAFSRSIGITLLLVVGLLRVTHGYHPGKAVDVALFALGIGCGLYLSQEKYRNHDFHAGPATFYLVANLLTLAFLVYFAWRLWNSDAKPIAVVTVIVSAAATAIALYYDFFPRTFPFESDDEVRTWFYVAALTVWGCQMITYLVGYRALEEHNKSTERELAGAAYERT